MSLCCLGILTASARVAAPCQVAWDRSASENVAGYAVYFGTAGAVTNRVDAGDAESVDLSGLNASVQYYFYVVAYNELGQESAPSEMVSYTPDVLSPVSLSQSQDGRPRIAFRAAPGSMCLVEFTDRLNPADWRPLHSVTADDSGRVAVEDPSEDLPAARFYRAVQP